jgi:predicted enzyme related to lactoylglutathione lyase
MSNGALGALGIGVSDLDRSVDFYTRVLGMQRLMTFTLPYMDEVLEVTREPTPVPELGDAVVGLAKDPDGYVIELLQRPPRPGADAATAGTTTA